MVYLYIRGVAHSYFLDAFDRRRCDAMMVAASDVAYHRACLRATQRVLANRSLGYRASAGM